MFKSGYLPFEELAKEKIDRELTARGYVKIENELHKPIKFPDAFSIAKLANPDKTKPSDLPVKSDQLYLDSNVANYIKNITNYIKDNVKIQLIVLFDCSIEGFVNTFDLNICKLVLRSGGWNYFGFHHATSRYLHP
jgi:hypothetical protein